MIYNYIVENYKNGDPIFFSELPGESKDYLRQEMKQEMNDWEIFTFWGENTYNLYFFA